MYRREHGAPVTPPQPARPRANFISPAFDFSNVSPQKISWRAGGMIAACGSVLITPWNVYNNPDVIHYTLETLGAFIGPLFGVLIADYYLIRNQKVNVDDLFTMSKGGRYWYSNGFNPPAVIATAIGAAVAVLPVLFHDLRGMYTMGQYSWFVGMGLGLAIYYFLASVYEVRARSRVDEAGSDTAGSGAAVSDALAVASAV